jgi:hypothetical protein
MQSDNVLLQAVSRNAAESPVFMRLSVSRWIVDTAIAGSNVHVLPNRGAHFGMLAVPQLKPRTKLRRFRP